MRIVNLDLVDRALTGFGSSGVTHTPVHRAADGTGDGGSAVNLMRLAPGGRIARHPAVLPQLLAVLAGSGWVRGAEDVWTPITAGQGAFWQSGEQHETWTTTGLTALVVEAERSDPRSLLAAAASAPPSGRPAARVVCVNDQQQVLLMRWRAPKDGMMCWEPPGGGIEPGELPVDAARREWAEETGLAGGMVSERYVFVHRDLYWNGERFVVDEAFFLARCVGAPSVATDRMTAEEVEAFAGFRWVPVGELDTLPDRVEPADLAGVVRRLVYSSAVE